MNGTCLCSICFFSGTRCLFCTAVERAEDVLPHGQGHYAEGEDVAWLGASLYVAIRCFWECYRQHNRIWVCLVTRSSKRVLNGG